MSPLIDRASEVLGEPLKPVCPLDEARGEGWRATSSNGDLAIVRRRATPWYDAGVERAAHLTAFEVGLAPQLVGFDVSERIVITRWIEGGERPQESAARIGAALATLHGVPLVSPSVHRRRSLIDLARHYADCADDQRDVERLLGDVSRLRKNDGEVLCHRDPVPKNWLWPVGSKAPVLIDWEYAAAGDRYLDLAAVIESHGLGESGIDMLLASYAQCAQLDADTDSLDIARAAYRALEPLWARATKALTT
ncbi:MAG: phosphotransferase [Pseudomonadota bacterium]